MASGTALVGIIPRRYYWACLEERDMRSAWEVLNGGAEWRYRHEGHPTFSGRTAASVPASGGNTRCTLSTAIHRMHIQLI